MADRGVQQPCFQLKKHIKKAGGGEVRNCDGNRKTGDDIKRGTDIEKSFLFSATLAMYKFYKYIFAFCIYLKITWPCTQLNINQTYGYVEIVAADLSIGESLFWACCVISIRCFKWGDEILERDESQINRKTDIYHRNYIPCATLFFSILSWMSSYCNYPSWCTIQAALSTIDLFLSLFESVTHPKSSLHERQSGKAWRDCYCCVFTPTAHLTKRQGKDGKTRDVSVQSQIKVKFDLIKIYNKIFSHVASWFKNENKHLFFFFCTTL